MQLQCRHLSLHTRSHGCCLLPAPRQLNTATCSYTVVGKQAGQYRHSAAVATYVPGEDLTAQTATSASLPFHTHSFGGSMAIRALELGSAATGGQFNTVSDWQRLSYILAASAVAFFGYRSYTSVSGE